MTDTEISCLTPSNIIGSDDFKFVESFISSTKRREIGWHYIVDLTWIYSNAKKWPRRFKILDAGGGNGPTQFLLAEMGFDVTNIDLFLEEPRLSYLSRYKTTKKILDSYSATDYVEHLESVSEKVGIRNRLRPFVKNNYLYQKLKEIKYIKRHDNWRSTVGLDDCQLGRIKWLQGNLIHIPEIPSNTFDAVVSLSAIEHIPINQLPLSIAEMKRVVRDDGYFAITTSASVSDKSWYHEPSQGWCFSAEDLYKLFGGRINTSNPQDILLQYYNNKYLKENLADFYYKSGMNGMPNGRWNPQYFPVGISRNCV